MFYHIVTIGCQMNKADSERLSAYLESLNYIFEPNMTKADVVILVTCGVRQSAENRIYTLAPKIKADNPQAKVILTGCLSARKDVQKRLKNSVDIWLDMVDLPLLASKLATTAIASPVIRAWQPVCPVGRSRGGEEIAMFSASWRIARDDIFKNHDYLSLSAKHQSAFSAYVPIGNGCNNFCAYCVVPYARGREIYRGHVEILAEVKNLISRGYKEIILIAQNVNSYNSFVIASDRRKRPPASIREAFRAGGDLALRNEIATHSTTLRAGYPRNDKMVDFADLLKMIDELAGDFWIRFATSHPKDLSDKLIATVVNSRKVCPHWHIALQSGDDEILAKMNRQYTVEHYQKIVKKIRSATPQASITTDVIVGFPGETVEQFERTNDLIKQIGFDQVFISQYSPRPGTVSAKMTDDVSPVDKKRREQILDKTLKTGVTIKNKNLLGQEAVILVEKQDEKYAYGRSADFKLIRFATSDNFLGQFVTVIISQHKFFSFTGQLKE